ncbi:MAG: CaiB/BaiF CoA-transferase family protein [Frankiaceae bacterium]
MPTEDGSDAGADRKAPGPLAGLRVLDLTRLLPGGYCTLLMADLGADVIKVEEPGRGDTLREWPPTAANGMSGPFLALNRGKRSITCNLKSPAGRDILRDLVRSADVLIESFRPGVMDRLGVGYEVLAAENPALIYAAISGFGAEGSRARLAGHDLNYQALSGALSFSGSPASGPWPPSLPVADLGGGALLALVAILSALRVRDRTGAGQFCDVAMSEGVLSWLTVHAGAYAVSGRSPGLGTELINGGYACYGTYACADGGWVAVAPLEPRFFATLCDRLGVSELTDGQYDPARQGELRARLAEVFGQRTQADWLAELDGLDVCVTPVYDIGAAFADAEHRRRGAVVDLSLDDGSLLSVPGVVPRLSATPGTPGGTPPRLGADTDAVLAGIGRDAAAISELRAAGAV